MEGEGERKRKAGIDLNWNDLLHDDGEPPSEVLIQPEADGGDEDAEKIQSIMKLSRKELIDKIARVKLMLGTLTLIDGGIKLQTSLKIMEAELERRKRLGVDFNSSPISLNVEKGKKSSPLADESIRTGANGLSNGAPIYIPDSQESQPSFADHLNRSLDKRDNGKTKAFREEISTLNRCNQKSMRETRKNSFQQTNKKGSSRQVPFKSPSQLSINIDDPLQPNDEQLERQSSATPRHSDKETPSCFTKNIRTTATRVQPPRNTRLKNQKTVVLLDEEEYDNDMPGLAGKVNQSIRETKIYYPLREDPQAVEICYSDLECLGPEMFLSSTVMNFYIRYLEKRTFSKATRKCEYHFFDTYVYKKLKQIDDTPFVKFRRWWKGVNIFEKSYIFLPIHEDHHWSLVIICIPDKEDELGPSMLHLDSLGLHASKSIFNDVKSLLTEEWKFLRRDGLSEFPFVEKIWENLPQRINEKVVEVPQQKNDYDCGVFVLFFIERLIDEFPERLKRDFRMFGKDWFEPEEASNLRHKIRDLLKEEFKNAADNGT